MMIQKSINILNKINNRPLIIEKLFSYTLNRPYILCHLISNDNHLKNKLNNLFTDGNKTKNNLDKEFCQNLITYSKIKDIINIIEEFLKEKDIKDIKSIEDMNKLSKEQNKMKQKIKLLLIFDENCFYNSEKTNLFSNSIVHEIEIIFGNKFIHFV